MYLFFTRKTFVSNFTTGCSGYHVPKQARDKSQMPSSDHELDHEVSLPAGYE